MKELLYTALDAACIIDNAGLSAKEALRLAHTGCIQRINPFWRWNIGKIIGNGCWMSCIGRIICRIKSLLMPISHQYRQSLTERWTYLT